MNLIHSRNMLSYKLMLLMMLVLFISTIGAPSADAHGLGEQIVAQQPAGPYIISVWIDPKNPEVDSETHMTVSVQRNAEFVTDADVKIEAETDSEQISADVSQENAVNQLMYEGEMDFPSAGTWQIDILIDGEDGQGSFTFDLEVDNSSDFPSPTLIAGGVLGILIVGYVILQGLRTRRQEKE